MQDSAGQFNLGIQDSASDRRFRAVQWRTMLGTAGQCMTTHGGWCMQDNAVPRRTVQDISRHCRPVQENVGRCKRNAGCCRTMQECAGQSWAVKDFKGKVTGDFRLQVFSGISFPQAPKYPMRAVLIFSGAP